jgi:hypothetical protein
MQEVINELTIRGLLSQARNLQGLLNIAKAGAVNANANQDAWTDLANRIYNTVVRELNSPVNHDATKLLNKDAAALISSNQDTCFLDTNNKEDILYTVFEKVGNNRFKPTTPQEEEMLKLRTEQYVAAGLEQYYFARIACVNAVLSLEKFFKTKGDGLKYSAYSIDASREFIRARFNLTNFKNEINPNYKHNDADNIVIKFDYPTPDLLGLSPKSHTIIHWKDTIYNATLEFDHGAYLPVSGKLDEVIKKIVSYIMINFKNN